MGFVLGSLKGSFSVGDGFNPLASKASKAREDFLEIKPLQRGAKGSESWPGSGFPNQKYLNLLFRHVALINE